MNCKQFQRELPGYLYGEMSGKDRESFANHSESCPDCRRLLAEMKETVTRLTAAPGPEFSPGELTALRGRVREEVRRNAPGSVPARRRPGILSHPLFLPGALAAALIFLVVFRQAQPPPAEPTGAAALAVFARRVESEFQMYAEIWDEIEELESLFPPDPPAGSGAGNRGVEVTNLAGRGLQRPFWGGQPGNNRDC